MELCFSGWENSEISNRCFHDDIFVKCSKWLGERLASLETAYLAKATQTLGRGQTLQALSHSPPNVQNVLRNESGRMEYAIPSKAKYKDGYAEAVDTASLNLT